MVAAIKATVNNARWEAGYTAQEIAMDLEWQGLSRAAARRRANIAYFWFVLRYVAQSVRFALGGLVCKRYGHSKDIQQEDFVAGTRSADGKRWDDIDGGGIDWFCPRCGQGGRCWW